MGTTIVRLRWRIEVLSWLSKRNPLQEPESFPSTLFPQKDLSNATIRLHRRRQKPKSNTKQMSIVTQLMIHCPLHRKGNTSKVHLQARVPPIPHKLALIVQEMAHGRK